MPLLVQHYDSVLGSLSVQPSIPEFTFAVGVVWALTELLTMPRSRKQLDIPRGDWLTVALGTVPVMGMATIILWQFLFAPGKVVSALVVPSMLLCLAGIGLRTWSRITLGRHYTFAIDLMEEHRVIDAGPYRFLRHPMYLGTLVATAGVLVLTQSWVTFWLLALPTSIVYGLRLFKEESFLIERLGADYQTYAKRTSRLIPFIW